MMLCLACNVGVGVGGEVEVEFVPASSIGIQFLLKEKESYYNSNHYNNIFLIFQRISYRYLFLELNFSFSSLSFFDTTSPK